MLLNEENRYARQLSLKEIGKKGQDKLKQARVLCIGAGGLGSPVLLYLAAAGVGTIGIVDADVVELSNLQRQILYTSDDLGKKKVLAARGRLRALNPDIQIIPYETAITAENALSLLASFDIVADGTDNFASHYVINDACVQLKKTNVSASILAFEGHCMVFSGAEGPCYRCLYPVEPVAMTCQDAGVLGIMPGLLGSMQATEILKCILQIGAPLIGRLLTVNALTMCFREFTIARHCPTCTGEIQDEGELLMKEMTVKELAALREQQTDHIVLDVRNQDEYDICNIGGKLIPFAELQNRLGELDPEQLTIVHCRSGGRSSRAVAFLEEQGFKDVRNLTGGIMAWRSEIDPSLAEY
jgi:adenylyltransferase/sulfurtransferase